MWSANRGRASMCRGKPGKNRWKWEFSGLLWLKKLGKSAGMRGWDELRWDFHSSAHSEPPQKPHKFFFWPKYWQNILIFEFWRLREARQERLWRRSLSCFFSLKPLQNIYFVCTSREEIFKSITVEPQCGDAAGIGIFWGFMVKKIGKICRNERWDFSLLCPFRTSTETSQVLFLGGIFSDIGQNILIFAF